MNSRKRAKMSEVRVYAKGAGTGQMKPEDPYYSVNNDPIMILTPPGTVLPSVVELLKLRFKTPPTASIMRTYADLEPGKGYWKYWKYHKETDDYTWEPEWIRTDDNSSQKDDSE
jgi:hypothetical protein